MNAEVIARMRDRIGRMRKIISLAHDPRMIAMLEEMIVDAETDIKRLEGEQDRPIELEIKDNPEQPS
ncbi:MAG TPA: hypothetical protein VH392_04610 [Sphingomicrobium sp.]|jgi:hypothetical protein